MQGFMLGGLLHGIRVEGREFGGGPFDWLTPFSLVCGAGLLVGYALLGACWLVMKTTDELEQRSRKLAMPLLAGLVAMIVLVSIWTPLEYPRVAERWFSLPNLFYLLPIPLITAALVVMCWRGIRTGHPTMSFYSAVSLFVIAFVGLVISMYPYLVPTAMTLWDTAASPESQTFLLIGTAVLVPFILGYTVFVYYTFRGKIRVGEGYH
jgi:cytochrome d ubiquinol oxidase subunit II